MPYFKTLDGGNGHVNSEKVMKRLEERGFVRLKGKELILRIFIKAFRERVIPVGASALAFHFTEDWAMSIIALWFVQKLLD